MSVRDAILGETVPEKIVTLPQGDVLVRGLTVAAKDQLESYVLKGVSWRPAALRACCFDAATKEPLFLPDDDVASVPAHVVEPLLDAAVELNALTQAEMEELEGN